MGPANHQKGMKKTRKKETLADQNRQNFTWTDGH